MLRGAADAGRPQIRVADDVFGKRKLGDDVRNREIFEEQVAIFKDGDPLFLSQVILALRPEVVKAGHTIIRKGAMGREMYILVRGEAEVVDEAGDVLKTFKDGDFFGEIALLMHTPRTATVRAKTGCDLVALDKTSFTRILRDHPQFADSVLKIAKDRYDLNIESEALLSDAGRR